MSRENATALDLRRQKLNHCSEIVLFTAYNFASREQINTNEYTYKSAKRNFLKFTVIAKDYLSETYTSYKQII